MRPAVFILALCTMPAFAAIPFVGTCDQYFGEHSEPFTVFDPDGQSGFPSTDGKFAAFIHHAGPGTDCGRPGPPAGCHRYYVVEYADCDTATCPIASFGGGANLTFTHDPTGAFDRATGILRACVGCVTSVRLSCWHAPASDPVPCACPGVLPVEQSYGSRAREVVELVAQRATTSPAIIGMAAVAVLGLVAVAALHGRAARVPPNHESVTARRSEVGLL